MHACMRACVRALSPRASSSLSLSLPLPPQAEPKNPEEHSARLLACFIPRSLRSHPPGGSGTRARAKKRHTESDREVKDEATPQHAGDGLDGHYREFVMCVFAGFRACWFVGLVSERY
jgi:hypothetical protein